MTRYYCFVSTLVWLCLRLPVQAQTQEVKDSLIHEMCESLNQSAYKTDSLKLVYVFENHLIPFLRQYPESTREALSTSIYYRFQNKCKLFQEIVFANSESRGDWQLVEENPKSKLSKKSCQSFLKHKKYAYLEPSGDTVTLAIEKGYWIDQFRDGTYSKLKLLWYNSCEFDIEFLESNNISRKHLSKPGDRYRYRIIDKKPGYYLLSVITLGQEDAIFTFKLYY